MVLNAARNIADSIAAMFGRDCEVAVHDLRVPTHSLVYLVNGHVTRRQLGAPIRDLLRRVIPSLEEGQEVLAGYQTILDDGSRIKSSTVILRDESGDPVAALCINYNTARLASAVEALSEMVTVPEDEGPDAPGAGNLDDPSDFLKTIVGNVIAPYAGRTRRMSKEERLDVVGFLNSKGAFRIKGSVAMVAAQLGVSAPTVYRYIEESGVRGAETAPRGASA